MKRSEYYDEIFLQQRRRTLIMNKRGNYCSLSSETIAVSLRKKVIQA